MTGVQTCALPICAGRASVTVWPRPSTTWLANAAGRQAGPGLAPMSAEVRRFMDALGGLHPQVAALCGRVTLMVAGCVRVLKHAAA